MFWSFHCFLERWSDAYKRSVEKQDQQAVSVTLSSRYPIPGPRSARNVQRAGIAFLLPSVGRASISFRRCVERLDYRKCKHRSRRSITIVRIRSFPPSTSLTLLPQCRARRRTIPWPSDRGKHGRQSPNKCDRRLNGCFHASCYFHCKSSESSP